jgi:tagatose 6-phosphate kinase
MSTRYATVTLNPALDVTYHLDEFAVGEAHRPRSMSVRAGGKGVNVARVLHSLGEPVVAAGLTGGATGRSIVDLLERDGIATAFTGIAGESRRTVVIDDGDRATGIWEPGPSVSAEEWATFRSNVPLADVLVLSGSLPPGLPPDAYADVIRRSAGAIVVLDTEGAALHHGLAASPTLVKPNADELAAAVGADVGTPELALAAAHRLRAGRATIVVASLGHRGLVAATCRRDYVVTPAQRLSGNATGAGDALVAALARGLGRGTPWPDLLADAVGISAGAVAKPVAGEIDSDVAREVSAHVTVHTIERDDRRSECDHAACRNS